MLVEPCLVAAVVLRNLAVGRRELAISVSRLQVAVSRRASLGRTSVAPRLLLLGKKEATIASLPPWAGRWPLGSWERKRHYLANGPPASLSLMNYRVYGVCIPGFGPPFGLGPRASHLLPTP